MPIYEYKCPECGHKFEKLQPFSAEPVCTCPRCNGTAKRSISLASFVLKGTGWYVTDYPSKERKKAMESERNSRMSTSSSSSGNASKAKTASSDSSSSSTSSGGATTAAKTS